jgi:hypothetical protein
MIRKGNKWYSAFPPAEGQAQVITNNSGILAVTANEGLFGGHAAFLLESVDQNGEARVRYIHLTAGIGGLQELERTGSGSAVSTPRVQARTKSEYPSTTSRLTRNTSTWLGGSTISPSP